MSVSIRFGIVALGAIFVLSGCDATQSDPDLVFCCTCDSVQSVRVPAAGPAGKMKEATFVEGKFGKALYVPAHAAVAEFPFPNGLPTDCGTIEFWAKLVGGKETYSDGVDPYFFIVTKDDAKGWPVVFECNFNANNGNGGRGFFCGMSYGRSANIPAYDNRYASILGEKDPLGWHKYTIEWCREGLDAEGNVLQVSIDGALRARGIRTKADVEDFFCGIGGSVHLVLSNPTSGCGKSPIVIDEFRVWSAIRSPSGMGVKE